MLSEQASDPFLRLGPHLLMVVDEVQQVVALRRMPDGSNLRLEFFAELDTWISLGWQLDSIVQAGAALSRGDNQRFVELVAVH